MGLALRSSIVRRSLRIVGTWFVSHLAWDLARAAVLGLVSTGAVKVLLGVSNPYLLATVCLGAVGVVILAVRSSRRSATGHQEAQHYKPTGILTDMVNQLRVEVEHLADAERNRQNDSERSRGG